jgi:mRNA interferase MazF
MVRYPRQGGVWLIALLDPSQGSEIKKTRPCLVISPDEMNERCRLCSAPMTTTLRSYPTRVN